MSKIEVNTVAPQCGTTLTLGESGDTVTLGSGASQSGFGRTGTVDWQTTVKTTGTFTAANGEGYFLNTSGGIITVNLPAGSAGNIVSFADYARTWQTNNVTVTPNGTDKIGGTNSNANLNVIGQSVTFVFIDSTQGWVNTMDSTSNVTGTTYMGATVSGAGNTLATVDTNFKLATFTGPGTFEVTSLGNSPANNAISYVIVAGGGSASGYYSGGGAGGFRESKTTYDSYTASPLAASGGVPVSVTSYPITIGAGGAGVADSADVGNNGSPSSGFSITSTAGGAAGGGAPGGAAGNPGGSGGGEGYISAAGVGAGNTPPVSPPQGSAGGVANPTGGAGGGGGGATAVGAAGFSPTPSSDQGRGGAGGAGATTSIPGSPTAYAGGGGGGGVCAGGAGGAGGGGTGTTNAASSPSQAGGTNTGGGGGSRGPLGTGGSGVVLIRYRFQ